MMSRRRWLAGWGLLAGTYLTLALKHVLTGGDPGSVVVYVVAAAITFGFAAAVLPIMVPRARPGGDDPSGGDSAPPPAGGPQPPWWPEFERRFWEHLEHPAGPARSPGSAPAAQPQRR